MGIVVVNPLKTLTISTSGEYCSLQCDHCKGHFLKFMHSPSNNYNNQKYKSVLISGGFDSEGKLINIPVDYIKKLKERGFRINAHLGLVDEKDIEKLKGLIDEVSFDIVLSNDVIHNIFHLNKDKEDYKKAFELLIDNFSVSPHIIIGINNGIIDDEYEIVDYLQNFTIKKLIFIVFTPIKGTPMEKVSPPSLESIDQFLGFAREKLKNTEFYMGCVRPKGEYREKLDLLAIKYGFKVIVKPHPNTLELLKREDKIESYFEECCALV
ncbi:MAG: radical SAM protein [Dictyoglomus sp. NZ13-RE01]|nr:MAG: radical SAM protein [Dictyoglomus sp. NZ13-RE01]